MGCSLAGVQPEGSSDVEHAEDVVELCTGARAKGASGGRGGVSP